MTKSTGTSSLWLRALALAAFLAPAARAQQEYSAAPETHASPPSNALEVALSVGSAQGYSNVNAGGDLGVGADLGVGWRIDRHWMVGGYGTGALYPGTSGSGPSTFGASAGVQANYHFDFSSRPWIGLGAGWRGYWLGTERGTTGYQGLDLARLQVGFDLPINNWFTLAPVFGATLSTFLSEKQPGAASWSNTSSKDLSVFVFAGALARFDFFGGRSGEVALASR
jgi:hypothetical protein